MLHNVAVRITDPTYVDLLLDQFIVSFKLFYSFSVVRMVGLWHGLIKRREWFLEIM